MKAFELIIRHYMLMAVQAAQPINADYYAEMDAAFADFNEYMAEVADELDALQDQCSELRYEV